MWSRDSLKTSYWPFFTGVAYTQPLKRSNISKGTNISKVEHIKACGATVWSHGWTSPAVLCSALQLRGRKQARNWRTNDWWCGSSAVRLWRESSPWRDQLECVCKQVSKHFLGRAALLPFMHTQHSHTARKHLHTNMYTPTVSGETLHRKSFPL